MSSNSEPVLYLKLIELIKLSNIYLNHAPKHEKFGLCLQIRNTQYELFKIVTECQKKYHKKTSLTQLDIEHEKLRMLYRLYYELGYFRYHNSKSTKKESDELRRFHAINILINEIGSMIGGWIKHEKSVKKG